MDRDYSKYYTPVAISNALMRLITFESNCSVIDICCGSGNLLNAAKKANPSLKCYGVDVIDVSLFDGIIVRGDGRSFAIEHASAYDYALANPPFGHVSKDSYASQLFLNDYSGIKCSRLEIEMLFANLIALKQSGTLLAILPTTIIDGSSFLGIRKKVASLHTVQAIVDLPKNAFQPEKIKCSAVIIKKEKNCSNTTTNFYTMDDQFSVHYSCAIEPNKVNKGYWNIEGEQKASCLSIRQGSIPTNLFSNSGVEVLHTSKKATNWCPSIRHINQSNISEHFTTVENGDIIISRIGASAGQKCVYYGSPKLVSDCLFVVKSPLKEEADTLLSLDLCSLVGGLSTPHITISRIYNLYNATARE